MNKKQKLEVRKLRKKVVNETMEELIALKSKFDDMFKGLIDSQGHFEEVLAYEKKLYKKGEMYKEDKIDDLYLTEYIRAVFCALYDDEEYSYKSQEKKILKLLNFLESTDI